MVSEGGDWEVVLETLRKKNRLRLASAGMWGYGEGRVKKNRQGSGVSSGWMVKPLIEMEITRRQ